MEQFADLGLDQELLAAVARCGYTTPTPIQAKTIPLELAGTDVVGQAQTGTGKTAAFGLGLLQRINPGRNVIQALVIAPTRELAGQTQEELFKLGKEKHAHVQVVYGGADIRRQIRSLRRPPQILVGTPGRLLDHLNRHTIDLSNVQTVVLDEADEMLDMGFLDDIRHILKQTPTKRQTLLFSATMPPAIMQVSQQFMTHPAIVKVQTQELTTDLVDQYFVRVQEREKFDTLTRLLDVQHPWYAIIFGRTKRRVDELTRGLQTRGFNAGGIHGDLTQQQRTLVMRQFRAGRLAVLVATDVAARGLDISAVTHVYNYDIPQDPESYVHRIGRTGRAGKHGVAVTFVTGNERPYLRAIEQLTNKRMMPLKPPTQDEAFAGQLAQAQRRIQELVAQTDHTKYEDVARQLLAHNDAVDLVTAFVDELTKDQQRTLPVRITAERPLPRRHHENNRGHRPNGKQRGKTQQGSSRKTTKRRTRTRQDGRKRAGGYTIRKKK